MASRALSTRWFGVLLLEDGEAVDTELFPPRAEAIADRLEQVHAGEVLDEERRLAEAADRLRVGDERLLSLLGTELGSVPSPEPDDHDVDPELRSRAAIALARRRIDDHLAEPTRHLVQAVAYLDETHTIENRMTERLTSWARLVAPELVDRVDDGTELARLVARGELDAETIDPNPGVDPNEGRALRGLATSIVQQIESREPLERFVAELARDLAPNVAQLTTPAIAARLIKHAGGVTELAKQPASTIQMLGAERAVFKHLTEGAPPPKHGAIYRHPMIHEAHPDDRGSIARALAAKIAIAARGDAFTGNDVAGELEAELQARVDDIQRTGRRRAKKEGGS